jgi:hypothetical protein
MILQVPSSNVLGLKPIAQIDHQRVGFDKVGAMARSAASRYDIHCD